MKLISPQLRTERLRLRGFALADAPRVRELAGDREIAATTLRVPHPYEDGMAEAWIATHPRLLEEGSSLSLAILLAETDEFIGAAGLEINAENERAELGYWVGKRYWGNGFCTEAAGAVVQFAFEDLRLQRIVAHHFAHNPASGRVMEKLGMQREGVLRRHVKKWGEFVDEVAYGLLREEYESAR